MTQFIAEVGSSHAGSYDRALENIHMAAQAGCHHVKFQYYRLEQFAAPVAWQHYKAVRDTELPDEWLPGLSSTAHRLGLGFGLSVFHAPHVAHVERHCDFLKVSSYSMRDEKLHLAAVSNGRRVPVHLSTGVSTLSEAVYAVSRISGTVSNPPLLVLMHCVSRYPAHMFSAALGRIDVLRNALGRHWLGPGLVGYSDHTTHPAAVMRAALVHGASMVEVHVDAAGDGPESMHSWQIDALAETIGDVARIQDTRMDEWTSGSPAPEEAEWQADADGLRPTVECREAMALEKAGEP